MLDSSGPTSGIDAGRKSLRQGYSVVECIHGRRSKPDGKALKGLPTDALRNAIQHIHIVVSCALQETISYELRYDVDR
ncbi:hypothetical protein D3C80_1603890 [compost metagenome]